LRWNEHYLFLTQLTSVDFAGLGIREKEMSKIGRELPDQQVAVRVRGKTIQICDKTLRMELQTIALYRETITKSCEALRFQGEAMPHTSKTLTLFTEALIFARKAIRCETETKGSAY
jgi:hypothetical protein